MLWGGAIKDISSLVSGKGRLTGAITAAGASLVVWADKRLDDNGVYGQRVNLDGTLGNPGPSEVQPGEQLALTPTLMQNYPNPFNPTTTIRFQIPNHKFQYGSDLEFGDWNLGFVTLKVFDILGREVATLVNAVMEPGTHSVQWNANGHASGVYLYRLESGSFVQTKKLLLLQ
ncbi:MAG: T9SS type A sorting domain-containing protein [Ignavibacteriae bacterium]|nr:T9SS type A sorting domain-containing protein [Ignavibacteriota bacterium]